MNEPICGSCERDGSSFTCDPARPLCPYSPRTPEYKVRARRAGLSDFDERHGSENGYTNCGCHCDECREAHRVYRAVRQGRIP